MKMQETQPLPQVELHINWRHLRLGVDFHICDLHRQISPYCTFHEKKLTSCYIHNTLVTSLTNFRLIRSHFHFHSHFKIPQNLCFAFKLGCNPVDTIHLRHHCHVTLLADLPDHGSSLLQPYLLFYSPSLTSCSCPTSAFLCLPFMYIASWSLYRTSDTLT